MTRGVMWVKMAGMENEQVLDPGVGQGESPSGFVELPRKNQGGHTKFKKGTSGNPSGKRKTEILDLSKGIDVWEDLQHAYTQPPSKDTTEGQKNARKFYSKDPIGFIKLWAQLRPKEKPLVVKDDKASDAELRIEDIAKRFLEEMTPTT